LAAGAHDETAWRENSSAEKFWAFLDRRPGRRRRRHRGLRRSCQINAGNSSQAHNDAVLARTCPLQRRLAKVAATTARTSAGRRQLRHATVVCFDTWSVTSLEDACDNKLVVPNKRITFILYDGVHIT